MYLYDYIPFTEEVIMDLYDDVPEDTDSPLHLRAEMDAPLGEHLSLYPLKTELEP